MKRLWVSALCLSFGWSAGASGQQPAWRAAAPRPLALERTEVAPLDRPRGISLGRPQPLFPAAALVQPASFRPAADPPALFGVRAKTDDPLPLPADLAPKPVEAEPVKGKAAATEPAQAKQGEGQPLRLRPVDPEALPKAAGADAPRTGQTKQDGSSGFATEAGGPVKRTAFTNQPAAPDVLIGEPPPGEVLTATTEETVDGFWANRGVFYGSVEYLNWWTKGQALPPLVTTSPGTVPVEQQGVLGPNTTVLFGGNTLSQQLQPGARFTLGYWFAQCPCWAVESSGFFLSQNTRNFAANSTMFPVLGRPIVNQNMGGVEDRELTASPITSPVMPGNVAIRSTGSIRVDVPTQFWGAEVNARRRLCCGDCYYVDLLGGYRHLSLSEGVHISEDLVLLSNVPGTPILKGDRVMVVDRFDTRNEFNGGQVGVAGEYRWRKLYVGGTVKVALGVVSESIDIHGSTTITAAANGAVTRFGAGLLAVGSNSGHFTRNEFAVAPEVMLKVGYQVTDNLRVFVAYDFLYLSNVVRPGDQIDRTIDVSQVPFFAPGTPPVANGQRPIVPFRSSDFWAQGVSVGLEWRY